MLFKDIKQNYPVYILDKQNIKFTQGKTVSVSFPRMENTNPMAMGKSVLDIVIEADGKNATYAIPENVGIVYAGDIVLSTDREGIAREIEAMKTSAEQALASVDRQKAILEKSTKLLAELNPAFREKQEYEQRLSKMENSIGELKEMLSGFMNKVKS